MIVLLQESRAVFWNSASGLSRPMLVVLCLTAVAGNIWSLCIGGLLGGWMTFTSGTCWFDSLWSAAAEISASSFWSWSFCRLWWGGWGWTWAWSAWIAWDRSFGGLGTVIMLLLVFLWGDVSLDLGWNSGAYGLRSWDIFWEVPALVSLSALFALMKALKHKILVALQSALFFSSFLLSHVVHFSHKKRARFLKWPNNGSSQSVT